MHKTIIPKLSPEQVSLMQKYVPAKAERSIGPHKLVTQSKPSPRERKHNDIVKVHPKLASHQADMLSMLTENDAFAARAVAASCRPAPAVPVHTRMVVLLQDVAHKAAAQLLAVEAVLPAGRETVPVTREVEAFSASTMHRLPPLMIP